MTTNEVRILHAGELVKLGYDVALLHCDVEPTSIEGPYDLKAGHFPYCQIKWEKSFETLGERTNSAYVEVQVFMNSKIVWD